MRGGVCTALITMLSFPRVLSSRYKHRGPFSPLPPRGGGGTCAERLGRSGRGAGGVSRGAQVGDCSLDISRQTHRQHSRAEARAEETRERDGGKYLRDERLPSPEMFGPFLGGQKRHSRGRSIEVDPTKRRGHIFFNHETDAVSRSQIISVQTEPS